MKFSLPYRTFFLFVLLTQTITTLAQVNNLNHTGSGPYTTISLAISNSATVNGDTITVAAGNYNEKVIVDKSLTIRGADTTAVVSTGTGTGITVTANNVTIQTIKTSGCSISGITASGVSNLKLLNVVSSGNGWYGVQLTNVTGLLVTGGSYSCNANDGFYSTGGSNYTMTDVKANWNIAGSEASGFFLSNLKGTSTLTNIIASHNKSHGLDIRSGSTNITLNGGDFEYNGSSNLSDGGGISIFTVSTAVSNITLNGPITSCNNITCGIYIDAHTNATDSIKGLTIGQSGTVTFSSNGTTTGNGVGIILWGNVSDVSVTANFSKGTITNSAGIMIAGQGAFGVNSPRNVTIVNSVFQVGYTNLTPAISLADAQSSPSNICINDVTATDNTFLGASGLSAVDDSLIYDKLNNSLLGRVNQSGSKLPVELVSFRASIDIHTILLKWSTATEVNNYGFEVERRKVNEPMSQKADELTQLFNSSNAQWLKIGFVMGSGSNNIVHNYSYTDNGAYSGRYAYRLKQIDNDGVFKYSQEAEVEIAVPEVSMLHQNYPNPFNPQTSISYQLSGISNVTLKVYDVLGREVAILVDGIKEAGYYTATFSTLGRGIQQTASGVYFARFSAQSIDGKKCFREVRKMLFVK